MSKIYRIQSFKNAFGETRFRFVVESVLHKTFLQTSLHCWSTRAACAAAARRCGYKAR